MKHNDSIKYHECLDTQIAHSIESSINPEDIKVVIDELTKAGMKFRYREPKVVTDMLFVDVYYKKPTVIHDDEGNKFCIGYYVRTMKPEQIKEKIMQVTVTKTLQRPKGSTTEDWNTHYCIDFRLIGHAWPYGRKEPICGHTPKGMRMIYRYAASAEELRPEISEKLATLKRYIDNGTSAVK